MLTLPFICCTFDYFVPTIALAILVSPFKIKAQARTITSVSSPSAGNKKTRNDTTNVMKPTTMSRARNHVGDSLSNIPASNPTSPRINSAAASIQIRINTTSV